MNVHAASPSARPANRHRWLQGLDPHVYLREALLGLYGLDENPSAEQVEKWLPEKWHQRRGRDSPGLQAVVG